jgi:hypothetical protein
VGKGSTTQPGKPPLQLSGVIFALAANLLLPTTFEVLLAGLEFGRPFWWFVGLVAPFIAGVLTATYTRERGGMHAFIGGMISVPILALFIFTGQWQVALLAGAFCTLGGALTELALRRRGAG